MTTPAAEAAVAGVAITAQPAVKLKDGNGKAVSRAGVTVTVTAATTGASLSGATATTDATGLASFAALAIAGPVGNYALGFSSGTLTGATSTTVVLSAGPASQLTFTTPRPPAGQAGGAADAPARGAH